MWRQSSVLVISVNLITLGNGDGFANKFGVVGVTPDQQIGVQIPHCAEVVVTGGGGWHWRWWGDGVGSEWL